MKRMRGRAREVLKVTLLKVAKVQFSETYRAEVGRLQKGMF